MQAGSEDLDKRILGMAATVEHASPRDEAEKAREQAAEKARRSAEAAREAAFELKEAVKEQGVATLKAVQDEVQAAKDIAAKKTQEAADAAAAAKDQTIEYAVQTKEAAAVIQIVQLMLLTFPFSLSVIYVRTICVPLCHVFGGSNFLWIVCCVAGDSSSIHTGHTGEAGGVEENCGAGV